MLVHTVIIGDDNKYKQQIESFNASDLIIHKVHRADVDKKFSFFDRPYVAQVNYERLKVVYEEGGYYIDADYLFLKDFPDYLQVFSYVFHKYPDGSVINSFFGANQNNPLIEKMILEIENMISSSRIAWEIGSELFQKFASDLQDAKYVGEEYGLTKKGFLFHQSSLARSYSYKREAKKAEIARKRSK